MKTKEVIKLLQEEDPSGELEVSIGGVDILFIEALPYYYDGRQQVLVKNEKGNVIGGRYTESGNKVVIHYRGFSDYIWDDENFQIEYGSEHTKKFKEHHDKIRQQGIDCREEMDLRYFTQYIKDKLKDKVDELSDIDDISKDFYLKHYNRNTPIPEDIRAPIQEGGRQVWHGYVVMRNLQWDREVEIIDEGLDIILKKRGE
jgi:hypothetical protein